MVFPATNIHSDIRGDVCHASVLSWGLGSILWHVNILVNMSAICVIHYMRINAMDLADQTVFWGLRIWEKNATLYLWVETQMPEASPGQCCTRLDLSVWKVLET